MAERDLMFHNLKVVERLIELKINPEMLATRQNACEVIIIWLLLGLCYKNGDRAVLATLSSPEKYGQCTLSYHPVKFAY